MQAALSVPTPTGNLPAMFHVPAAPAAAVVLLEDREATGLEAETAERLNSAGFATLLTDALSESEHDRARHAAQQCSNIPLLAMRMAAVSDWVTSRPELTDVRIGYFASGTAAAAALWTAAERPCSVAALVVLDGRPLLAAPALPGVRCPTLFITRTGEPALLKVNRAGFERLSCQKHLQLVHGDDVDRILALTQGWFDLHLHPQEP